MATATPRLDLIEILRNGQTTQFWAELCAITQDNIEVTEAMILDKIDLNGQAISDADVDRLRDKRDVLKELLDLPEVLIKELSVEDDEKEENYDPFAPDPAQTG